MQTDESYINNTSCTSWSRGSRKLLGGRVCRWGGLSASNWKALSMEDATSVSSATLVRSADPLICRPAKDSRGHESHADIRRPEARSGRFMRDPNERIVSAPCSHHGG